MRRLASHFIDCFLTFLALSAIVVATNSYVRAQEAPATTSLIVKLAGGLSPGEQEAVITTNGGVLTSSIPQLKLFTVEVPTDDVSAIIQNFQSDVRVISVEVNKTRKVEGVSTDYYFSGQWALPKIGWDLVYGNVTPAGTAKVAVLDTGADASHPDLAGNVVSGFSIFDGSNGMSDPNGHGTWLAGIIAAQTNNGEGIAGVGYAGVQIIPVTVLSPDGTGQDSDIIAGVLWAADNGADVILMGFSNPGFSQNLQDAIDYAWAKGIILVAASGNDGLNQSTFPAGHRGVMGVSATDLDDTLVPFSNYGKAVFLAAPGVDIPVTDINNSYVNLNGTSASSAIVAGVAAFMRAVDPTLSNGVIVGRLARNADPAGTQEETGNGRVNMARVLEDTSVEEIQPAGAPGGGPIVGPYIAASVTSVTITSPKTTSPVTITSLPANVLISFNYVTSTTGTTSGTADVLGASVSASKGLTPGTGSDSITVTIPAGTANASYNVKMTVTNTTGGGANNKNDNQNGAVIVNVPSDTTPPVITPNVSGTLGDNGWYVSDVTVSWTVTDNESTVTSKSGCDPTIISTDTAGQTLTCTATSGGGTTSKSVTVKRDATPPTASASASPAPNASDWNNADVTVSFSGSDSLSGVASCSAAAVLSTEGAGQSASGTCTDKAGNVSAPATASGINIDKTPPTITWNSGINDGDSFYFGFVPSEPTCTASDVLSGPNGCSVTGYRIALGSQTLAATAFDKAGNEKTETRTYTILAWTLKGFYQPVGMGTSLIVWNVVKGGSTVPLKFEVFAGPTELTETSRINGLTYKGVVCASGVEEDIAQEDLPATGGTALRYDLTEGQFIFNWKTPKSPGACYKVTMTTQDSSKLEAYFRLK